MKTTQTNMHPVERISSAALGGLLGIGSLRHPSPVKLALAAGLLYRGLSGHSYLYQALDINMANGNGHRTGEAGAEVECALTSSKAARELYDLWRDPRQRARILGEAFEITAAGGGREHWKVTLPGGRLVEWDAEFIEERPGEILSWKSLETAPFANDGSLSFQPAPGGRGTEIRLTMHFNPPGGLPGQKIAQRLSFVPRMVAENALRRLKSLAETGEMPTLLSNPSARAHAEHQSHRQLHRPLAAAMH